MKTSLVADINAPSKARAFVVAQLVSGSLPFEGLVDRVVLIASELVTNAVQAGATAIEVSMRLRAGRLDLVVTDDAAGWPAPVAAGVDDTAGRGLSIVEHLADAWDVAARRRGGKVITASWFVGSDQRTSADF